MAAFHQGDPVVLGDDAGEPVGGQQPVVDDAMPQLLVQQVGPAGIVPDIGLGGNDGPFGAGLRDFDPVASGQGSFGGGSRLSGTTSWTRPDGLRPSTSFSSAVCFVISATTARLCDL
ncbi:hypothetical protein ACWDLG_44660 [Nonomuraea sp. NPDC003727]